MGASRRRGFIQFLLGGRGAAAVEHKATRDSGRLVHHRGLDRGRLVLDWIVGGWCATVDWIVDTTRIVGGWCTDWIDLLLELLEPEELIVFSHGKSEGTTKNQVGRRRREGGGGVRAAAAGGIKHSSRRP